MTVRRKRALLLGGYVAMFGGVISYSNPVEPDMAILYIESPQGQLSWRVESEDMDLFEGLKVPLVESYPWDGHTNEEKYLRVEALNRKIPKMTYPRPEYGKP
ncbi:Alpha-ketoglutarate-dependent taurine dioxygenase [Streptomyces malaysiensis]|uniref:Alpha-ketoglutarate-dependent taurine dioxygenase n=1 Tax=Streptomyces malaysiensis TaxID=92644 RepID=A0A7X6AZS2_STRMQ|nr:Alpha-ketoglutarate-dependent taurine dioxygenase [Streptomyces malaysiensis]